MMEFVSGAVSPSTIGLAFGLVGALIAFYGFLNLSDCGIAARSQERNSDRDLAGLRELYCHRYDLRWAVLFIATGFGLQFVGSLIPELMLDSRIFLMLVIGLITYVGIRDLTIRHDMSSARDDLEAVRDQTSAPTTARFPRAAA